MTNDRRINDRRAIDIPLQVGNDRRTAVRRAIADGVELDETTDVIGAAPVVAAFYALSAAVDMGRIELADVNGLIVAAAVGA